MIPSEPNGPIDHYQVMYQPVQSISGIDYSTQSELNSTISTINNFTKIIIPNLYKATSYSFIIVGYTDFGPTPPSVDHCVAYTMEDGEFHGFLWHKVN